MTGTVVDVADALDHLVDQFSERLSFFRELIQNSIDAGTSEVDIRCEWVDEGDGLMTIHVDDFGEGMDREIIDSKLTRLFSSGKDGDLTKIGRFGIGFVSVFAVEPDAVCVDTSRAGESWRVLFDKDRKFTRIALDAPVDGTKIRIYKTIDREGYEDLVTRAREVIRYWCKHVPIDLVFQGDRINAPLDLDAPCKVTVRGEGTDVVAAYLPGTTQFFGFYNRGLTLLEGDAGFFPGIAFKVSSRYLEHTMTRDNVIRDAAFEKAMALVHAARTRLVLRVLEMIEEHVVGDAHDDHAEQLYAWARLHAKGVATSEPVCRARALIRDLDGRALTFAEVEAAAHGDGLLMAREPNALTQRLIGDGRVVIRQGDRARDVADLVGAQLGPASARFCLSHPPDDPLPAGWEPMRRALLELLTEVEGVRLRDVVAGHLGGPRVGTRHVIAAVQDGLGTLTPRPETRRLPTSFLARKRVLVLNLDHMLVRGVIALADRAPRLAAYLGARLVLLGSDASEPDDVALCLAALEARWGR